MNDNNNSFSLPDLINDLTQMIYGQAQDIYNEVYQAYFKAKANNEDISLIKTSEELIERWLNCFFEVFNSKFVYVKFDSKVGSSDYYSYNVKTNYVHYTHTKQELNPLLTDYNELLVDKQIALKNLQVDRHVYINDVLYCFIENKNYLDLSNQKRALSDCIILFQAYLTNLQQQFKIDPNTVKMRFYLFAGSNNLNLISHLGYLAHDIDVLNLKGITNLDLKAFFLTKNTTRRIIANSSNPANRTFDDVWTHNWLDKEKIRQVVLNFLYDLILYYHYYKKLHPDSVIDLYHFDPSLVDISNLPKELQKNFFTLVNKLTTNKTKKSKPKTLSK